MAMLNVAKTNRMKKKGKPGKIEGEVSTLPAAGAEAIEQKVTISLLFFTYLSLTEYFRI